MPNDAPIMLTRAQHIDEIVRQPMSHRERMRQIDEMALDVLYDDQLRQVAYAMAESLSEKRASHMLGAITLHCLLWFGIIVAALREKTT